MALWPELESNITSCRTCPRLVAWREAGGRPGRARQASHASGVEAGRSQPKRRLLCFVPRDRTPHSYLETHHDDAFRPLQAEIIASLLAGRDALAVMPTGSGKSLY